MGNAVHIAIEDDGPGIPIELRDRVVEPFFTTKADGEGTGIGLARAHGFAAQNGGKLDIGASLMGGAKVTLVCPSGQEAAL